MTATLADYKTVESIVLDHAEVIMEDTEKADRDDWLVTRKAGIGGSDAAASAGMSPWDSQYGLWAEKLDPEPSDEDNDFMKWGRRLEVPIGLGFAEDTGIEVVRYPKMLRSKQWPWAQVNVDFLTPLETGVVEVKNVNVRMSSEWEDGAVPAHYSIQGQHELAVTGLPHVWFAALVGGNDARYIKIERNDQLITNLMEIERQFWELVQNNTPPAVDGSESTAEALNRRYGQSIALSKLDLTDRSGEVLEMLDRRDLLKANAKMIEEDVREIDNNLKALLGDYELGTVNGTQVFSWKTQDRKAYEVPAKSFRVLRVTNKEKR